ncbi:hypothetical protein NHF50_01020 [Flavobacterium sp. NRK F10]|uniref:hypothetical protein n=1 Tax=Flavobacterium sp. NRK F10 TaxID=2954931 RepID=UPI0020904587|nr:hypothetical protein [Flavobacterium sp. NRK F10]MCO6173617.1 hypothetical protein [Flavobacterium sp. NRK F10]
MRLVYFIFLSFSLFISCNDNKQNSIEIYLLKNRKLNSEGVQINTIKDYNEMDTVKLKSYIPYTTFDTIKNDFIYSSKFEFKNEDLNIEPFIDNNEINSLDINNGKLVLNNSGARKLFKLRPSGRNGEQFVIKVNDSAVFSGYFYNSISSYGSDWNCINIDFSELVKDSTKTNYSFDFFKGNGIDFTKREKIDFKKYPELLEAFKESDRLKEDKNN